MRVVVQRVKYANVKVDGKTVGEIEKGFLVLIGIKQGDNKEQADYLSKKVCNLRVFTDENDKMNLSLKDVKGKLQEVEINKEIYKALDRFELDGTILGKGVIQYDNI